MLRGSKKFDSLRNYSYHLHYQENVMADYTPMQAHRMFDRLMRPRLDALEIAEQADFGFDSGEFSGPALWNKFDREQDRVLQLVAAKTGLTVHEVHTATCEAISRAVDACYEKGIPF